MLDQWYREQLRATILDLIPKWEAKLEVSVLRWSIRRMKTKWGSCNRETRYICFNVELAKKHPDCLEYIVVHEMAHYFDRNHGQRFTSLMDKHMPHWRTRRDQLNGAPLAEERWKLDCLIVRPEQSAHREMSLVQQRSVGAMWHRSAHPRLNPRMLLELEQK